MRNELFQLFIDLSNSNCKYSSSSIVYIRGNVNIAILLTKVKKPIHRNTYIVDICLILLTFDNVNISFMFTKHKLQFTYIYVD